MNVIIMLTIEEMLLLSISIIILYTIIYIYIYYLLSIELYVLRCHRYQTIWIIIVFKLTTQT